MLCSSKSAFAHQNHTVPASWLLKWREAFKRITIGDACLHRGLYTYILFNISSACVGVFTSLQISSRTKAFTLECLQAKGRANATKGCFYEWGSCGFILLQRFMHLGAVLHCLNGAFLLWYDFILSLVQESCIKHLLSFIGWKKHWFCSYNTVSHSINAQ